MLGKVFLWCKQVPLDRAHRSSDRGSRQRCFSAAEGKPERSWGYVVTQAQVKRFLSFSFRAFSSSHTVCLSWSAKKIHL